MFRTYTVRRVDPERANVDVDFVVHHDAGPAGAWAEQRRSRASAWSSWVLTRAARTRRIGLDWHPGTARRLLLAGDETAAPAIAGSSSRCRPTSTSTRSSRCRPPRTRCRSTCPSGSACAGSRATTAARRLADRRAHALDGATSTTARAGRGAAPQQLDDIDVDVELLWDSPEDGDGEFYAWIAGEAAMVKTIRRAARHEHGVDRKRVAFMGYWRLGQAERIE